MAATQTHPHTVADALPEPGQAAGATSQSAGDADELIARLAEEQIDKLLADDAGFEPEPVAVVPNNAADAPAAADAIGDLERSAAAANAVQAALDAIGIDDAPVPPSPMVIEPTAPAAEAIVAHDIKESASSDANDVAAELAADAKLHGRSAEPPAARQVETVGSHAEPEAAPIPTIGEMAAHAAAETLATMPATDSHDVKMSLLARLLRVPWLVLEAINYPVRDASDNTREMLGVIAIVTVVNSAGLLIYRLAFAKH